MLVPTSFICWAGSQISSPSRRPLQDYHRKVLANPSAHGLQIESFTSRDGTPCLLCVPDPSGTLGKRGTLIRRQLAERGIPLPNAGRITGNLVLLHGRRGRKEDYLPIAERLCASGFRCIIPDLPAHGDHPATTATYGVRESGLSARILTEASQRFSFPKQPVGLIGMSMGGSVANHAAALPDAPWKALVIISSFDSFPGIIEGQANQYVGSTLGPLAANGIGSFYQWKTGLELEAIQPCRQTPSIHIPTLVAHGTADQTIPLTAGHRLFDSFPQNSQNKWVEIPGAGHDNVLITDFPIYAEIAAWMILHVTAR
jgi:pimeloyl-ACP methyl ester carboxylesterase